MYDDEYLQYRQQHSFRYRFYIWTTAIVTTFFACGGFIVTKIAKSRTESARVTFNQADKFELVLLMEQPSKVCDELNKQAEQKKSDSPLFVLKTKGEADRTMYSLRGVHLPGYPEPEFLLYFPLMPNEIVPRPIYRIYKGNDAMDRARGFLEKEGYSSADIPISSEKWQGRKTQLVQPKKGDSVIKILAFWRSKGRLYLWDGEEILDVSKGFTSNEYDQGEHKFYERYLKQLLTVAN